MLFLWLKGLSSRIGDKYDPKNEIKVILSFFLTDVIKENGDLQRKVLKQIFKTKNGRLIMQFQCAECGIKRSRFVKKQGAKGLLSSSGNKTPLSKIPLLIFFVLRCIENEWDCR